MKILCTFSGKFGDILWSLPTVREIALIDGNKVDFGIMPQYESLLPLLNAQVYIDKAFVIPNWVCTGSPCGDQPWEAPVPEGYDKVYHLTYRNHPAPNQPLIDFIAQQQGIALHNPVPFISLPKHNFSGLEGPLISFGFNPEYRNWAHSTGNRTIEVIRECLPESSFIDVSEIPWLDAAALINRSACFIGCRSSNYVLACGLGARVFVHEPNFARSKYGPWGTTFTCPYANETEIMYFTDMIEEIKSLVAGKVTQ